MLPSVVPFDLGVAVQAFGHPRPDLGVRRYSMMLCTLKPGRVKTSAGFWISVENGLAPLRRADTIIITGIEDLDTPITAAVTRALADAYKRGARMVSLCTGTFVLGAAGLLDGRRVSTHWKDARALAARFPKARVDSSVLYIDEGRVLTCAGIAAGIDLCLRIVRKDFGAAVATEVTRRLVGAPHRTGGQPRFLPPLIPEPRGHGLESIRDWVVSCLSEPLTVSRMANYAGKSLRAFARHCHEETGSSPLQWLLQNRILAAQQLLEETDLSVNRIAEDAGFGSPVSLRAHFRRVLRTTPLAYRRAFRLNGLVGEASA